MVSDRPKVLAPVAGRPFLSYLLDQLCAAKVERAVLCTGYLAPMIAEAFGDRYRGIELEYSVEERALGTGGALAQAASLLRSETVLVLNGDSYCDCDLDRFAAAREESGAGAGMALTRVDDVSRYGAVVTGEGSRVRKFSEKGGASGPGWINAGIYLLPTAILRTIPAGREVSLEREIFPELLAGGLYGHPCTGTFIDIGVPEDLSRAHTLFGSKKGKP